MKNLVLCEEIEVQVGGPSSCGTITGTFTTTYKKVKELPPGGKWLTREDVEQLIQHALNYQEGCYNICCFQGPKELLDELFGE